MFVKNKDSIEVNYLFMEILKMSGDSFIVSSCEVQFLLNSNL